MIDQIYTVEKAAELLGLSDRIIRELANSEELKGYKKNGRWFFLHSDLVAYIKKPDEKK